MGWFAVEGIPNMLSGFIALIVIYLLGIIPVFFMLNKKKKEGDWTWKSILYQLMFRNVFELRDQLSSSGVGYIPGVWCILIKHIIPSLLLILFINLAGAQNSDGKALFGNYGGYVTYPYQFLGILIIALTLFLLALGFVRPDTYDILADPEDESTLKDKMGAGANVDDDQKLLSRLNPNLFLLLITMLLHDNSESVCVGEREGVVVLSVYFLHKSGALARCLFA